MEITMDKDTNKLEYGLKELGITDKNLHWYKDKYYWKRKDLTEEEKAEEKQAFKKQKEKYGFDERECWNLDITLAAYIYPRLKVFKEMNHISRPFSLKDGDEWEQIIDKMLWSFEQIIQGYAKMLEITHYDDSKKDSKEIDEYFNKINDGLFLFAKYFQDLWD
jgi:hypothetical protein